MNKEDISFLTEDKLKKLEDLINLIDPEEKVFKKTKEKLLKKDIIINKKENNNSWLEINTRV